MWSSLFIVELDGQVKSAKFSFSVLQTRANIKRLTKTFVTLSLDDVATRIGLASPQDAEKQIVAMIQEGSIHARISQKDGRALLLNLSGGPECLIVCISIVTGMVQFDANPERFNSVSMLSDLEKRVSTCIALNNQITQMDEDIVLSASYIKKASCASSSASSAPVMAGASGTMPGEPFSCCTNPTNPDKSSKIVT